MRRLRSSLASHANAALPAARERVRRIVRYAEGLASDAVLRVQTRGVIKPKHLLVTTADSVSYEGTSPFGFTRLLRLLDVDPGSFTFVDLGCGKGRTLILAARNRFARAVGVEIAPELLAVAQRNLARFSASRPNLRTSFELVEKDAAQYVFPADGPLLVFMYNPFGQQTMRAVARNLDEAVRASHHPVLVLYYIPRFPEELDRLGSLHCIHRDGRRVLHSSTAAVDRH